MSFKSPLGRVRHLGSAKDGTHHWWMQRVTALALVPLAIWFAASLVAGVSSDYESAHAWIGNPFVGGLLLILVVATFYPSNPADEGRLSGVRSGRRPRRADRAAWRTSLIWR